MREGTVLTADSLRASYSLMSLVTRRFVSRMYVWSPELTVSRMASGTWNVVDAFAAPDSLSMGDPTMLADSALSDSIGLEGTEPFDTTGTGFRSAPGGGYELDRLEIIDGRVRVASENPARGERWTVYDGIGGRLSNLAPSG